MHTSLTCARAQLVRAGHEVRLWIAPDYLSLVPEIKGLSVHCGKRTCAEFMENFADAIVRGKVHEQLKVIFDDQAQTFADAADSIKAMCDGWAEILIYNSVAGHMAFAVTEVLHIKALHVMVQPLLPSRESFVLSGNIKLPKCMRMFCWWLILSRTSFPDVLQRAIAEWKAANGCTLPPISCWDQVYRFNGPYILGFSPTSFPPPADWEDFDFIVAGALVLSAADLPEKPAATLVEFLKAGVEPPLYIGWGSMAHESGQYMTELAVRALRDIGKRGILFEGSSGCELVRLGLDKLDASKPDAAEVAAWAAENVLVTGGVSHEWLFPQMAAVLHHGGAGTSAACFRAGVPSLVTPLAVDQHEFARLTVKHDLGPGPLPELKAVSTKQLSAALLAAVREPRYKAAAVVLRDQMHQESGTKLAVAAFEKMCNRHIWMEDAARHERGVTHAITPPSIIC